MCDSKNIADFFGCNVFNDAVMQEKLPSDIYRKLKKTIEDGAELDFSIAGAVAHAMKEWAVEHGATHYTHWFQPLTGVTAEKHESFISAPNTAGKVIMEFSARELTKGESDASSFPSGGLRATFEARGYTAWDCTSPAFLREDALGVTLCIPTAFCSYKGEALDKKTPLLRSMQAINDEALRIVRLFGNTTAKRVLNYVGAEQEYFIIDREKYLKRPDLMHTGRTLFGAMPPKGQELEDHYYGSIQDRIASYMNEVNHELWKLGVPAKTQHNEVAPAQHELAPVYEQANRAVDHNQIMMEVMKKVSARHGLQCLLHEKPFAGVNGSGKHNNWSITTDNGINLLNPGDTPHENIQFLLVLACIVKAVDVHADLLREAAAVAGNDHRLGSSEAPPAIISIFVGEQLEDVIDQLIETGAATHSKQGGVLKTGVNTLPDFEKDATDRNRTSPFAFTNNKFEFRMVGSSDSVASGNIVLNTIVAESFREAVDILEKADNIEEAVHDMIKDIFRKHRRIIFNGNGYSQAWVEEAKRRGLPNIRSTVEAIPALTTEKAVRLFESFKVFTRAELVSRQEVEFENYCKIIHIEAKTMADMANKLLIPAVIRFISDLAQSAHGVQLACPEADTGVQKELIMECSGLLRESKSALSALQTLTEKTAQIEPIQERANAYRENVVPAMQALREPLDKLESLVDKRLWPLPSYSDLMFEV